MSVTWKWTAAAVCLAATLGVAHPAQAQSPAARTAPPKTAAPVAAVAQQADTPEAIFARWDTDHNQVLTLAEFQIGWQQVQATMALRLLHDKFVAMDTHHTGCLDPAQYANLQLIKQAGQSAPPLSRFDTDKNGCLNFKEYVGMVSTMLKNKH